MRVESDANGGFPWQAESAYYLNHRLTSGVEDEPAPVKCELLVTFC